MKHESMKESRACRVSTGLASLLYSSLLYRPGGGDSPGAPPVDDGDDAEVEGANSGEEEPAVPAPSKPDPISSALPPY